MRPISQLTNTLCIAHSCATSYSTFTEVQHSITVFSILKTLYSSINLTTRLHSHLQDWSFLEAFSGMMVFIFPLPCIIIQIRWLLSFITGWEKSIFLVGLVVSKSEDFRLVQWCLRLNSSIKIFSKWIPQPWSCPSWNWSKKQIKINLNQTQKHL